MKAPIPDDLQLAQLLPRLERLCTMDGPVWIYSLADREPKYRKALPDLVEAIAKRLGSTARIQVGVIEHGFVEQMLITVRVPMANEWVDKQVGEACKNSKLNVYRREWVCEIEL